MSEIYAVYDSKTDRMVGIYGTHKTIDDDRRNMLATVDQPGEYWHKEAQAHPDSWQTPEALQFVLLDSFYETSDRNRLVREWRSNRFTEARALAKKQTGQTPPPRDADTGCPDRSFVERMEQWVALTTSLFGGDMGKWVRNASDADREKAKRILERKSDLDKACQLAENFYNRLNNYDMLPDYVAEPTATSFDDEIPF